MLSAVKNPASDTPSIATAVYCIPLDNPSIALNNNLGAVANGPTAAEPAPAATSAILCLKISIALSTAILTSGLYFTIIFPVNIVVTYVTAAPNLTIASLNASIACFASSLLTKSANAVHILDNCCNLIFAFPFHSSSSCKDIAGIESLTHIQYVFSHNMIHLPTRCLSSGVKSRIIPIPFSIISICQAYSGFFCIKNLKGSGGFVNSLKLFILLFICIFICCGFNFLVFSAIYISIYIIMIFF